MNYCPHCGRKQEQSNKLCPSCGRRLMFVDSFGSVQGKEIVPCARCKGHGEIETGGIFSVAVKTCPACGGAGVHRI